MGIESRKPSKGSSVDSTARKIDPGYSRAFTTSVNFCRPNTNGFPLLAIFAAVLIPNGTLSDPSRCSSERTQQELRQAVRWSRPTHLTSITTTPNSSLPNIVIAVLVKSSNLVA